ncbi:hypothetical protein H7F15_13080 [Pontibacter sp. Tf4]|uniref:hypothetical protein n=1 Tax=Pontibacter sp. Tf4 TaxID=2761620 RepID=UPI001629EC96|nr:hypothetical protein [Pontibacter sp. Tf4]MBB6611977.1 hypothetical protein [Pontibacter sp. Tf4]
MDQTYSLTKEAGQPKGKAAATANKASELPDEALEFATIDGGVVDFYACEQAVSNGAGIFIGGYFVGVTEFTQCYTQQTLMRK